MKFPYILVFLVLVLGLGSCRKSKDLIYWQNVDSSVIQNGHLLKERPDYQLRVNDILYVRVMSPNQEVNAFFNPGVSINANQTNYSQDRMYFEGYSIDQQGNIQMPVVGTLQVFGLTVAQARDLIGKKVLESVKDATVFVKLASFRVTLLGEVVRPGTYNFYNDKLTLIEALGQAGDLTDFGSRRSVLILRNTDQGVQPFRVDLTDKSYMLTDLYYLKPNDVIYVEPLKTKGIRLIIADYGVFITAITSTLTTLVLVFNLL